MKQPPGERPCFMRLHWLWVTRRRQVGLGAVKLTGNAQPAGVLPRRLSKSAFCVHQVYLVQSAAARKHAGREAGSPADAPDPRGILLRCRARRDEISHLFQLLLDGQPVKTGGRLMKLARYCGLMTPEPSPPAAVRGHGAPDFRSTVCDRVAGGPCAAKLNKEEGRKMRPPWNSLQP